MHLVGLETVKEFEILKEPLAYSHEVPTLKLRQRIAVEGIQSEVNMINNFCAIFALISGKANKFKIMFMVAFVSL